MASKKVNVTFTSNEGCSVNINGTVSFGLIPPRFTGFSGTITLSGSGSCPKGTLTFSSASLRAGAAGERPVPEGRVSATFDTTDASKLRKVSWAGEKAAIKLLNQAAANRTLCDALRAVPYATIAAAA